jgi:hypothetical protein
MADVPTGRMVKNPNYQSGDSWDGVSKPEIWQPYTDEERRDMGYKAYQSSGAEEKMRRAREAQDAMLTARGGRPPGLGEIATPQGSDYLPNVQTGAYSGGPGYFTSVDAINKGQREGLAALAEGAGIARSDISGAMDRIRAGYDPYTSAGSDAARREAALSGALGPEEQQAAIDAYMESPGQKYLREQMERSLLRNTAAIGGLGGGNVRTALQEQAMGIASTQQQQYLENLRSIAMRGQEATGTVAGYESSAANNLASIANALGINSSQLIRMSQGELAALAERTGVRLADIQSAVGAAQAQLAKDAGTDLASVAGSMTGDVTGMRERQYTTDVQAEQDIGTKLANLATISGTQSAQYTAGAGSSLAAGKYASGQAWGQGLQGVANMAAYTAANLPQTQPVQPVTPTFSQPSMPWNQGTAPIHHTPTTAFGM